MKFLIENKLTEAKFDVADAVYGDLDDAGFIIYALNDEDAYGYRLSSTDKAKLEKAINIAKKYKLNTSLNKFGDRYQLYIYIPESSF